MTRLLGTWLNLHHDRPTDHVSSGWQPLPDDVVEWMGMNPYPLED